MVGQGGATKPRSKMQIVWKDDGKCLWFGECTIYYDFIKCSTLITAEAYSSPLGEMMQERKEKTN